MADLKKNFIYQIAYQMLTIILPLITSPYLSRVLGSQGLGEYSYTYSIAYYFSLFILLGVNNHGTREIAKVKNDLEKRSEVFWSIYSIQFISGVLIVSLYIITQIVLRKDNTLASIQLLYVLSAVLDINWLFFGLEKFRTTVTRNVIVKIATVVSIFLFVKDAKGTTTYTLIMALGFLISQVVLWPFTKKIIIKKKVNRKVIIHNIKQLLILFIPVISASIFKYMDKIMLGLMYSKSELGLYDNTEKIMSIPTSVITAVGTVMLPRISGLIGNNNSKKTILNYIKWSIEGSIMLASALTFGMAAIADGFSVWFWGKEFARCGGLIKAIAVTVIFLSWANVIRTQFLIPYGKDSIFVRATIYGAIINFIINILLIKPYGAMGTVIGTVMAEFIVAFYQTIKCRNDLPIREYLLKSIPYIGAGIIMYLIIQDISRLKLPVFIILIMQVLCGMLIYGGLLIAYLVIVKKISVKKIYGFIRK